MDNSLLIIFVLGYQFRLVYEQNSFTSSTNYLCSEDITFDGMLNNVMVEMEKNHLNWAWKSIMIQSQGQ